MVFKLIRIDTVNPMKIQLNPGNHRLGRGADIFECDDKRVSRKHGELNVTEDSVVLKSLHSNPCFYTKKHLPDTQILTINSEVVLANGDKFGLLPNLYWYELIHCSETVPIVAAQSVTNETSNVTDETSNVTDETNYFSNGTNSDTNGSNGNVTIKADDVEITEEVAEAFKSSLDETVSDLDISASLSLLPPAQSPPAPAQSSPTPAQSSLSNTQEYQVDSTVPNQPVNSNEIAKTPVKREPESNIDDGGPDVKRIKVEQEVKNDGDQSSASGLNADPQAPQQGSSNNHVPPPNPNPTNRERCMYGAQCYRQEPQRSRRVTYHQLEALWQNLNTKRDLATGYNKSTQAREESRRLWMQVAKTLNAGDGAVKHWSGWSKYWADYKSKLRAKVAEIKASQRTGEGPLGKKPLSDIEKKFLVILGEDYGSGLPGGRVEPIELQPQQPVIDSTQTQPGTSNSQPVTEYALPGTYWSQPSTQTDPLSDHDYSSKILITQTLTHPESLQSDLTPLLIDVRTALYSINTQPQQTDHTESLPLPTTPPVTVSNPTTPPPNQPKSPRVQSRSPHDQSSSPPVQSSSPPVQSRSRHVQSCSPPVQSSSPPVQSRSPPDQLRSPRRGQRRRDSPLTQEMARRQLVASSNRRVEIEEQKLEVLRKIARELKEIKQRKNPQHKAQFSHPGDGDWGFGAQIPCPFGAQCTRTDPRHFRDHSHPDNMAPNRRGKVKRPRRKAQSNDSDREASPVPDLNLPAKRVRKTVKRQSWSGDESANEDPFLTDGSDDWTPNGNDVEDF